MFTHRVQFSFFHWYHRYLLSFGVIIYHNIWQQLVSSAMAANFSVSQISSSHLTRWQICRGFSPLRQDVRIVGISEVETVWQRNLSLVISFALMLSSNSNAKLGINVRATCAFSSEWYDRSKCAGAFRYSSRIMAFSSRASINSWPRSCNLIHKIHTTYLFKGLYWRLRGGIRFRGLSNRKGSGRPPWYAAVHLVFQLYQNVSLPREIVVDRRKLIGSAGTIVYALGTSLEMYLFTGY
jgi:hypothetical protein